MAFIRQYAMSGDPFGRLLPKRKQAAVGPRMKAARKATVRQRRMLRFAGDPFGGMVGPVASGARPSAGMFQQMGQALSNFFKGGGGNVLKTAAGAVLSALPQRPLSPTAALQGLGLPPGLVGGGGGGGGGGGRRRVNPANVKALTRGLRRVESFGRLVSRVNRLLPRGHRYAVSPVMKKRRKRRAA